MPWKLKELLWSRRRSKDQKIVELKNQEDHFVNCDSPLPIARNKTHAVQAKVNAASVDRTQCLQNTLTMQEGQKLTSVWRSPR
jgi:hypothetical protein